MPTWGSAPRHKMKLLCLMVQFFSHSAQSWARHREGRRLLGSAGRGFRRTAQQSASGERQRRMWKERLTWQSVSPQLGKADRRWKAGDSGKVVASALEVSMVVTEPWLQGYQSEL